MLLWSPRKASLPASDSFRPINLLKESWYSKVFVFIYSRTQFRIISLISGMCTTLLNKCIKWCTMYFEAFETKRYCCGVFLDVQQAFSFSSSFPEPSRWMLEDLSFFKAYICWSPTRNCSGPCLNYHIHLGPCCAQKNKCSNSYLYRWLCNFDDKCYA